LVESIRKFPTQEVFAEQIRAAGFQNVSYENLTFGVVAIHSGFKAFENDNPHKTDE
jgi:demethylmenaquinone methyltransferase/2-methoxy-6-polyprenyl-1,4-benzoquinol methylase